MNRQTYWVLAAYYGAFFAALGIMLPYWPLYLKEIGLGAEQIGILVALIHGMRVIGSPIWGHWADQGSRKTIIIITSLATLAIFSLYYFGTSFWYLVVVTLLYSFVHSAPLALVDATAMEQATKYRGQYGRIRVWGSIGFIAAAQLVGLLLDWQPVTLILPIITLLILFDVLLALLMPHEERHTNPDAKPVRIWSALTDPRLAWFYLAALLMQFSHSGYYGFFSLHMQASGYSRGEIGSFWSIGVLAEVLLLTWSKPFLKIGVSKLLIISLVLTSLRWSVYVSTTHWLIIGLVQTLHAFSFGAFHVASVKRLHDLAPPGRRASTQSWYSALSFGIGGGLGMACSGYLYQHVGAQGLFAVMAATAALGVFACYRAVLLYHRDPADVV
ncbi:major facilitator superfamily MFS_1 [Magnetococcus marinus MC-1]|uniref:Major facilitator superfamily MFS_1 n=1 Tax=Magnetococcus marinus (strain ATCC BAA-1437 / JCM 17883 / MC-1) TaxID=156889 RepID=A0LCQ9_MAGMM|nr:MFS transporter [Magnetococcus marinus]ABK45752.1 major facilitator superfamily MFS_1 [Magnetococcus marinus MC-1]